MLCTAARGRKSGEKNKFGDGGTKEKTKKNEYHGTGDENKCKGKEAKGEREQCIFRLPEGEGKDKIYSGELQKMGRGRGVAQKRSAMDWTVRVAESSKPPLEERGEECESLEKKKNNGGEKGGKKIQQSGIFGRVYIEQTKKGKKEKRSAR